MDQNDRIHLRDHVVDVEIGAFQTERGQTQRLRFNLTVDLAEVVAGADDQVDRILSYDVLTGAVATTLADQRYNLLESVAERIAAEVLAHPRAARIEVTVEKLDRVPGALGVTIARSAARIAADGQHARATVLSMGALDRLPDGPLIAVPAAPDLPLPQGGNDRMVALLALDQAAWALAGRLGVGVADSRTEIDWAVLENQQVVWAPARMIADVPGLPADPVALCFWLAARLNAQRLILALPDGASLPTAPDGFAVPIQRIGV